MNRRGFLECAALLVGGVTASQASFSLTDEQKVYLATASDYVASETDFFTSDQRELITHFSEIIIPETQTCLLYTTDAADERDSVDLGGRRSTNKTKRE